MKTDKINKFFNEAINEMFQAVGFSSFDPEFAKQENWYRLKSWSEPEEEKFKQWFIQTSKQTLKWNTKIAEKEFSYFNFMYGWHLKEPKKEPKKEHVIQYNNIYEK